MEQPMNQQAQPRVSSPPPAQTAHPPTQQQQQQQQWAVHQLAPAPHPVNPVNPIPPVLPLKEHDRRLRRWRLGIRIFAFIVIAASLILFLAQGAAHQSHDDHCITLPTCDYVDYGEDLVSVPVLACALAWNLAEFITYCINGRGAHPIVHMILDFIMFSSMLSGGIYSVFTWGGVRFYAPADVDKFASARKYGLVGAGVELAACILHLTLFIMACVAMHRLRRRSMREMMHSLQNQGANQQQNAYPPPPPGMVYLVATQPQQPADGHPPQVPAK